jgi:hypothetical protein
MWYITVNGKKLPTPYLTFDEAMQAMEELRSKISLCILDCVYE